MVQLRLDCGDGYEKNVTFKTMEEALVYLSQKHAEYTYITITKY